MNILTKYGKVELIILRCFEELSLKEIKKQYDLGEKYCIDYLKRFDLGEYNESLQGYLVGVKY